MFKRKKVKSGKIKLEQRYKCKECVTNYTKEEIGKVEFKIKVQALKLYLEGMGFRTIGRILKVSNVSVLNWIRIFGNIAIGIFNNIKEIKINQEYEKIELDEMWHYVKKKNRLRIWIACEGRKAEIIEWSIGNRGEETGIKFKENIKDFKAKYFASDYWSVYEKIIEKSKHIQTKAETYTIEGLNNRIRHYLARFHRKTHCYSKSEDMVNFSLVLFAIKDILLSILS